MTAGVTSGSVAPPPFIDASVLGGEGRTSTDPTSLPAVGALLVFVLRCADG